jgi:hypothetical protein
MLILALVTVLLSPWKGATLPTTPTGTYQTSYALNVHGTPHQRVALQADGVAKGWIAAFCTPRLCSPFHTMATLDGKGNARYEFSLIRTDPKSAAHAHAVIRVNGSVAAGASSR